MGEINRERFLVWKYVELAGILHGKKRRLFIEKLEEKLSARTAETDPIERIIRTAQISYPENKRMRRKYLVKRLKERERTTKP